MNDVIEAPPPSCVTHLSDVAFDCYENPVRVEVLGTGAFSVVKLATRRDGQKSAVKVVERRKLGKNDLEALRGEAKLLGELDHPNIVKLHGWFEEESTLYMALELCEGELLNFSTATLKMRESCARSLQMPNTELLTFRALR